MEAKVTRKISDLNEKQNPPSSSQRKKDQSTKQEGRMADSSTPTVQGAGK